MRLAPVICCISSFTPSPLATISAISMSKPIGYSWRPAPKGGASSGTPMRTTPFDRMSWRSAALAGFAEAADGQSRQTILER